MKKILLIVIASLGGVFAISSSSFAKKCPRGMVPVKNAAKKVSVCVDKYEYSLKKSKKRSSRPLANVSFYECRNYCAKQQIRLLTHNEWVVACEGTKPRYCNRNKPHPVIQKLRDNKPWVYGQKNCKNPNNAWRDCMKDPSLNRRSLARNGDYKKCVSKYGVHHMVGNLGEWVHDFRRRDGDIYGRFNGGLYPQKRSSCDYTTKAHKLSYKDYSIGCRCAIEL